MQLAIAESWVLSTRKTLRKGNIIDIYPTLVDLAGISKKENLDGESLLELLCNLLRTHM